MDEVSFIAFPGQSLRSVGTRNLNGCIAVMIVSQYGAILAHIPPRPVAARHDDPQAGDQHCAKKMTEMAATYRTNQRFFPIDKPSWIVSAMWEGKIALPSQRQIIETKLRDMGLNPSSANYTAVMPPQSNNNTKGTVFIDARAGGAPRVYVEDTLIEGTSTSTRGSATVPARPQTGGEAGPQSFTSRSSWTQWSLATSENKIILLVKELDDTTRSQTLEITIITVETWIRRVLEFPEEASPPLGRDNARSKLRKLAPLIQGLDKMTNEGDFLILPPSGVLNRVPIHALPLEKRTLIERNLIIYFSSATIFRQCHMRAAAQATENDKKQGKAVFLAVYDGSATEAQLESSEIYDHADKVIVDSFPFDVHTGSMVTKLSFGQMANKSSWVHFHGHALFEKRDILRSFLVLSDGADRLSSDLSDPDADRASAAGDSENLTVADIFNIDMLRNAPHFTFIGCNSSTQDIAPGDEPLGILSALLYVGATSVVGTLWPVDSYTARLFTKIFYEHLRRQVESQLRHLRTARQFLVVNMAAALQSSVREMMDRSRQERLHMYCIAPGSMFFPRCILRKSAPSRHKDKSRYQ